LGSKDHIQENMESNDPFIKEMYRDLHNRIKDYQETDSVVEKMQFSDARGSIVIVGVIAAFLAYVLLT